MSYAETRSPPPAGTRSAELRRAEQAGHHALSPNAQAWRRLAIEGYHRTAELVRATRPAPLQAEGEGHNRANADSDAHHSGFQSL